MKPDRDREVVGGQTWSVAFPEFVGQEEVELSFTPCWLAYGMWADGQVFGTSGKIAVNKKPNILFAQRVILLELAVLETRSCGQAADLRRP